MRIALRGQPGDVGSGSGEVAGQPLVLGDDVVSGGLADDVVRSSGASPERAPTHLETTRSDGRASPARVAWSSPFSRSSVTAMGLALTKAYLASKSFKSHQLMAATRNKSDCTQQSIWP